MFWRGAVLIGLLGVGCKASEPTGNIDTSGYDAQGPGYADVVVALVGGDATVFCSLPAGCGAQSPACGPKEVLGAPDGMALALPSGATLEVGFLCRLIVEKGGVGSADFKIHATVSDGAMAAVEASEDGSNYTTVDVMTSAEQPLDLAKAELATARFVRIRDTGGGGISIDAIGAL